MADQDTLVAAGNRPHSHGAVPIQTRSERPASYEVGDFAVAQLLLRGHRFDTGGMPNCPNEAALCRVAGDDRGLARRAALADGFRGVEP